MKKTIPSLFSLFIEFFIIGAFTFGGGIAMLPIIKRKLIAKDWINGDDFGDFVAVAQTAPGAIAVNLSTAIGFQLRGIVGALTAATGMVLPSLIVITLVAMGLQQYADIPSVHHALQGITVVVVILMVDAIVDLSKSNLKDLLRIIIAVVAFIAIYFAGIPTTMILGVAILLGVAKTLLEMRGNRHA